MRNPFIRLSLRIPVPGACRWFRRHNWVVKWDCPALEVDTRTSMERRTAICARCGKRTSKWVDAKGVQK
jgi:hypothetical protein